MGNGRSVDTTNCREDVEVACRGCWAGCRAQSFLRGVRLILHRRIKLTRARGKNAFALSKTLAEAIGRSFIETALDSSVLCVYTEGLVLMPVRWPNSKTTIRNSNLIFELLAHSKQLIKFVISVRDMLQQQSSHLQVATWRSVVRWDRSIPSISLGWKARSMPSFSVLSTVSIILQAGGC